MRLRSLQLHGFKSFADRTTLEFRDGVTAIVGSNGCGKSNIADAVRWVLGEQRASAIRGSKMEEVIFQGTTRRRPLHFAEVSLLFENDRGRVAVPQTEIEVARKVFREGGSEYALNRNPCRLRDIHNLLRDTGLGSNAYAIIEAGMIETLLSDRAEERRLLFEEAAGIGRYKDSRQAAVRRMAAAEADLARLEDLIIEVENKVRSLARQKRRAERHRELQARRLDLEVALAQAELTELHGELLAGEQRRGELEALGTSAAATRSTAELGAEERRAEVALLVHRRGEAAARLERARLELDAREREVLVAEERRSHGELRIQQLVRERAELEERLGALAAERAHLDALQARQAGALASLRERLEERGEGNQTVRAAVAAARAASEAAAARAHELAREIATAEGERTAADRRRRHAQEQLDAAESQARRLGGELAQVAEQTELWGSRAEELRGRVAAAADAAERAREEIRVLRSREQAARDGLRTAEDALSRLAAQVAAREALERGYEGFAPAVMEVMGARGRFPGVHGPLADWVRGDTEDAAAMEAHLGPLLQALVVDGLHTARELRRWFRSEWQGGGALLLLPLDAPALASRSTPPDPQAWVRALLADLVVVQGDPLDAYSPGSARAGGEGDVLDARGVVRLADRAAAEGILQRRQLLERLRAERAQAERVRDRAAAERETARAALEEAEERALEAEELRRVADGELRRVEADAAAHQHRRGRLEQDRGRLASSVATLRASVEEAGEALQRLQGRLAELAGQVAAAGSAEQSNRARLAELEASWEEARDEEAELRVAVARAEAELAETQRRAAAAEQGSAAARQRMLTLEEEAEQVRQSLHGLSGVRERAGAQIEELFLLRDREAAEVARLDIRLAELDSDLAELGEQARVARRREGESAEERHQLELRLAELRSLAERAVERLEVEWGRPWDALVASATPVENGSPDQWRSELRDTGAQLEALGPVNMLAVEEHGEEEQRLNFLLDQRNDLNRARDDLNAAIRQINRTAREVFQATFDEVRTNFHRVFQSLFQGGECDIWLTDPEDPLESPVEILASPKGKRTQRIHLLSGGERTLTALALLFALYLVKPSPFCVLDEVDAPLDESNVGRFIQLLQDFKSETQFVVITHNPRTMEAADWVYGVTMEDPGVSTIVGVELLGAWRTGDRVA